MTIQGPDHPTDYRMVKLTDGTLLVGTISTNETELTIENPLQLTTVQRLTEVGMKDDSSLAPWIPFTNDKMFVIPKDKVMVVSRAAKELANYYSQLDGLSSYWLSYTDYRDHIRRLIPVEIQRKIRASCDIWEMHQSSVDCNLHLSQNEINKTYSFVLGDDFSKKEELLQNVDLLKF